MLLPIIMILVCVLLGGGTLLFLKFSERRKKAKSRDKEELAQMTANEFVNVKDIRGSFLYTRDGMALAYLKIFPISTELFSKNEKRLIAKQLTVSLSSGQYPFQLLAVSRPVDISPLMAELSSTGEHYVIDGIDGYLTNEPDRDYQFIIYDCGVIQTPTSVFREADHRLLCGSVLPYEIPAFHKALEVCGGLEVRPVAISVPGEFRAYCRELFGGEMEMAEASHDLFANRTNGRLYKRLIEPYIMGERRL